MLSCHWWYARITSRRLSTIELPDSVFSITHLDSLSTATTSHLRPFILPPRQVGGFDPMESGMMSRLRLLRLPTRGAAGLLKFGYMGDIGGVVNVVKDWSQSDNSMCRD